MEAEIQVITRTCDLEEKYLQQDQIKNYIIPTRSVFNVKYHVDNVWVRQVK